MTGLILAFSALLMAQLPLAGDYVVMRDDIAAQSLSWGAYCGTPVAQERSSKGQTLKVTLNNEAWTATGGGRRFGSRTCEGQNLSLKMKEHRVRDGAAYFKCESTRVVLGTELTTHEARVDKVRKRVIFKSTHLRTFRKGSDLCELKVSRETELQMQEAPESEVTGIKADPEAADESSSERDAKACNVVGEPKNLTHFGRTKIRVKKAQKYCFDIKAVDHQGCVVAWAPIRWRVSPRSLGRINKKGCFRWNPKTKRTKGKVVARYGRRQLSVPFTVVDHKKPPAQKPLTVAHTPPQDRVDAGPAVLRSDPKVATHAGKEVAPATNALRPSKKGQGLPVWLGLLLILLALIGWSTYRFFPRSSKRALLEIETGSPAIANETVVQNRLPRARASNPRSIRKFKVYRGRLTPNPATGILMPSETKTIAPGTDFDSDLGPAPLREYCPECGRRYPPTGRARCPVDGALLETLTSVVPTQFVSLDIQGRICNICFERFDADVVFCTTDNVPLMTDLGQWDELKATLLKKNENILSKRGVNVI
jgi:hypothetical protein